MCSVESLLRPPIAFAHRGARAHAPDNTLESFRLALRLGATGLETDVWVTADGIAVLDHDGVVRAGGRRRNISAVERTALPSHVPTLAELYETCGTDFELSIDVKDAAAASAILAVARDFPGAEARLWLCHHDWQQVAQWRELSDGAHLVDSTRLKRMKEGPERRAFNLSDVGIDAVNLHHTDWTAGLTTLFHRFERYAFAWDAQHERVLASLLHMGVDAVYSDHVDRMLAAVTEHQR